MIATAVCAAASASLLAACDTGTAATGSASTTSSDTPAGRDTPAQSTTDIGGCEETQDWSTEDTQTAAASTDALYQVRAGKHDCYDRVVVDIDGPAEVGYLVGYVPAVTTDGSGAPVQVDGDAALQVIVRAPTKKPVEIGDDFYAADQLAGWESLRAVRFAGSFEGQSTLAIGVRETLPFRVSTTLDAKDQNRRLVIDIAHEQT